jgi:hypothetical protein
LIAVLEDLADMYRVVSTGAVVEQLFFFGLLVCFDGLKIPLLERTGASLGWTQGPMLMMVSIGRLLLVRLP